MPRQLWNKIIIHFIYLFCIIISNNIGTNCTKTEPIKNIKINKTNKMFYTLKYGTIIRNTGEMQRNNHDLGS